jgi:hypothetical protein
MRLTYNYTNNDYALHPEEHTDKVVPLVRDMNNYTETYDVSHWEWNDVAHFESLTEKEKVELMKELKVAI